MVDIKEKVGYVAEDFEAELKKERTDIEKEYEMPDGTVLHFDRARFQCIEPLFTPSLLGFQNMGLCHMIYQSITQCDSRLRADLLGNICLNGGNTMFEGIEKRIYRDLTRLVGPMIPYSIVINGYLRQNNDAKIGGDVANLAQKYCGIEEIERIYGGIDPIKVIEDHPLQRKYKAWIGGSIWGSLSSIQEQFVTKQDYDELGPTIVHQRCF